MCCTETGEEHHTVSFGKTTAFQSWARNRRSISGCPLESCSPRPGCASGGGATPCDDLHRSRYLHGTRRSGRRGGRPARPRARESGSQRRRHALRTRCGRSLHGSRRADTGWRVRGPGGRVPRASPTPHGPDSRSSYRRATGKCPRRGSLPSQRAWAARIRGPDARRVGRYVPADWTRARGVVASGLVAPQGHVARRARLGGGRRQGRRAACGVRVPVSRIHTPVCEGVPGRSPRGAAVVRSPPAPLAGSRGVHPGFVFRARSATPRFSWSRRPVEPPLQSMGGRKLLAVTDAASRA